MDDLMQTLQQAMQDPNTMATVQKLLENAGSAPQPSSEQTGAPDLSGLLSMLGGQAGPNNTPSAPPPAMPDMGAFLKLQQAFSKMNAEDDNTRLLRAIRPYLRPERQEKADQAIRMLRLFALLPALTESGLLAGLIGGKGNG